MKTTKPFRFFRSFAFRIYAAFALCVLVLLAVNWLLNSFMFADHYRREKESVLVEEYETIDELAFEPHRLTSHLASRSTALSVLVWNERHVFYNDLQSSVTGPEGGAFPPLAPLTIQNGSYRIIDRPFFSERQSSRENVMTLYGKTENGINVVLQVSLDGAAESTAISNRFLLWSTLAALVIGCVIAALLVRSFTRPAARLSEMARRMAHMDFGERIDDVGHSEWEELRESLNTTAETMESTFSELKTANARLLNENEKSEKQNEARRSFISNVSHELKTPIALIQTYSEGLRENAAATPEEREYYCQVIEDEAGHLSQIISRMTMLMQLESGKADLQIERFSIRSVCERLLERHTPLFEEKGIPLPYLPDSPAFVWGDAFLIENVLTNYLTNALNHVNEKGFIRLYWKETDHSTVRISVFNTGSFIPEEDIPRVWESFYKVDKAHTRSYGGSGIGLSVVAAIMNVHRMPYGVANTADGVEFYFELPLQ